MSGKQSRQVARVYDANDWKKANRIERILIHIVDPDVYTLNNQDEVYYSRIRECMTIMKSNFSEVSINEQLRNHFPTMNSAQINQLKIDCNNFYNHFDIESKKISWIKQHERIMRHIEKCDKVDDMKTIAQLEKTLMQMRDSMPEEIADDDANMWEDFDFTTDERVLDVDYQDVSNEEE